MVGVNVRKEERGRVIGKAYRQSVGEKEYKTTETKRERFKKEMVRAVKKKRSGGRGNKKSV